MKNYKNFKELGYQLFKVNNNILLVDLSQVVVNEYGYDHFNNIVGISYVSSSTYFKIIASKEKIQGIPILNIINDKDIVEKNLTRICNWESFQYHPISRYAKEALDEYKKLKENKKFNKEQLLDAFELGKNSILGDKQIFQDDVIKSITESEKELYIEVKEEHFRTVKNDHGQLIDHEIILVPNIQYNELNAIWK